MTGLLKLRTGILWGFVGLFLHMGHGPAAAQDGVISEAVWVLTPSFSSWHFSNGVAHDSLSIIKASQLTFPVSTSIRTGRLTVDATGAVAVGSVGLEDGRTFELSGLTDLRVRGVVRVIGDRLLATVGLNAPVGKTHLAGQEVDALGVIGSPVLGFNTPTLGNGFGATGGLVYAWRVGEWGLAVGSTFESRAQYTPIEARITGGVAVPADLKPGNAYRFSLAADRLIGQSRLSILFATDQFAESRLTLTSGGTPVESQYKLGPQFSGALMLELGVSGFQSFVVTLADRYRSKFTGLDGEKAEGSSGNVLEGAVQFVTGSTRGAGLFVRANAWVDSGLDVDNTLTTAAMTAAGLSVGVAMQMGRASILPYLRGQIGRLDAGPETTTATGFGGGVVLTVRP